MIYAICGRNGRSTLVEFPSLKQMEAAVERSGASHFHVESNFAHSWVKGGREHETGLFVDDDGKVRYARSEKAKAEGEIHSPPGRSAPSIGSTPRIGLTSDGAREPNNETINLG